MKVYPERYKNVVEEHFGSPRGWAYQRGPWKLTRGYICGHAEKGFFRQRAQCEERQCKCESRRVVGDEAIEVN